MMNVPKLAPLLLVLSLFVFTPAHAENAPDEIKVVLQQLHFTDNLKILCTRVAKTTQTYQMIESQIGAEKADTLLNEKITAVLPKYQGEWDTNMAAAFQKYMTLDDLNALKKGGTDSPAYQKLKEQGVNIDAAMEETSKTILGNLTTDVVSEMFADRPPGI